ncbi:anti-sigma factor family protein [Streptomyces sp. S399]|uniref:anti-sigma factor family protein n=1 Tax=Streptomyces sp. S399 TaxID=3096009 RepID=UPI0039C2F7EA
MSGSRPTPVEQHLGDRLAALVDGELGHEARERVLAHLATCCKCKAEADAQRRLKSVFATAAPPPPTESFLARLQGLPAAGPDGPTDSGSGFGSGPAFGSSDFGAAPSAFRYAPLAPPLPDEPGKGFRIHDIGRAEAERSASRGRRFAFAAAGAVSLAALALGGSPRAPPSTPRSARAAARATSPRCAPSPAPGRPPPTPRPPGRLPARLRRAGRDPFRAQGRGLRHRPAPSGHAAAPGGAGAVPVLRRPAQGTRSRAAGPPLGTAAPRRAPGLRRPRGRRRAPAGVPAGPGLSATP